MKSATEDSPDMPAVGRRWYQRYRTHDDHTVLQIAIQTICDPNYQPSQHTTTHHPASGDLAAMLTDLDAHQSGVTEQDLAPADRVALAEGLGCVTTMAHNVTRILFQGRKQADPLFRDSRLSPSFAVAALRDLAQELAAAHGAPPDMPLRLPENLYMSL